MAANRPVTVELVWSHDFQFQASSEKVSLLIDGDSTAGPSPVQLLAMGLASCMGIDVLDILAKGRQQVTACQVRLSGIRAETPPRRLLEVALTFVLEGDVTGTAVERAIALSRDKYCSVWQSMRQDIVLRTAFEIRN